MKKLLSRVIASAVAVILTATSAMAINPKAMRSVSSKALAEAQAQGRRLPAGLKMRSTNATMQLPTAQKLHVKKNATILNPRYAKSAATIVGNVCYSNVDYVGMAEFDVKSLEVTPLEGGSGLMFNGGATLADGKYVGTYIETFWGYILGVTNYIIDPETWEIEEKNVNNFTDLSATAIDMACDPETGDVYGIFYDADLGGIHFGILNIEEWTSSDLGPIDEMNPLNAIAFDEEGTLYGITALGEFGTVDKDTGELDVIAETGLETVNLAGAVIDPEIGVFYYTPNADSSSTLYAIDLATGNAELVGEFGGFEQMVGLYIPTPAAANGAPAMPTDVEVEIADDLTGTVTFNAPDETYGGDALTGTLTYFIYEDGGVIATGTCEAGTTVEAAVKLTKGGEYTIRVSCKNEVGEGPKTKTVRGFAGSLIPPYSNDFSEDDAFEGWEFIDANGDQITWTPDNGVLVIVGYFADKDMDDYAVTPPFSFESGKSYKLTVPVAVGLSSYPERLEVLLAKGNTEDDMADAEVLIAPTYLYNEDPIDLSADIAVKEDGKYYIVFHCISDADKFAILISGIEISAPFDGNTPRMVENVVFTPATNGDASTHIQFNAPTLDINGDELTGTLSLVATLDGEEFWSTEAAPGSDIGINCTAEEAGTYTIEIVASNANGAGTVYSKTLWLGVDFGAAAEDVKITEWANEPGKITLSWAGVAKDCNGNDIDASMITYMVLDLAQEVVEEGIPCDAECKIDIDAVPAGEQTFVMYYIVTVTERGPNNENGFYAMTPLTAVGTPYEMPMIENFDGGINYAWMTRIDAGSNFIWEVYPNVNGISPVDGDKGMIVWWPYRKDQASLLSGKILVAEAETVAFSFFYYAGYGEYELMPFVSVAGYEYDLLDEPISTYAEEGEWKQVVLPLVDYCGNAVQVGIHATCVDDSGYLLIDQICAKEMQQYDLSAASIAAPKAVEVGKKAVITAEVANQGMAEAEGFSIQFYANGEKMGEALTPDMVLEAGATAQFETSVEYDIFSDPEYTYYFEVIWDMDENPDNNMSINASVIVSQPMVPAVEDLEAAVEGGNVVLTWSAPDTESRIVEITDDVESYESFAINQAGDWTFVDVDQSNNHGFNGIGFPGAGQPAAFIVFDTTDYEASLEGFTHSGNKVFACFAADNGPNDDWMISPNLPGMAQTISFMARAWTAQYGLERFEVYYSLDGPTIENMVMVSDGVMEADEEWTKFSFELPEGATNFAIRCVSNDRFVFLVDDITFTAGTEALTIENYNVYMDGKLIGDTKETSYTAELPDDAEHVFFVTVVYEGKGESALSNPAVVNPSGIADAAKAVRVRVEGRQIVVENAESVLISAADGKVVASANGQAKVNATVAPGVYVVKANANITKVIVK